MAYQAGRLPVIIVIALSSLIGVTPVLCLIGKPLLPVLLSLFLLILIYFRLHSIRFDVFYRPHFIDFVSAGTAYLMVPAVIGFLGMIIIGMLDAFGLLSNSFVVYATSIVFILIISWMAYLNAYWCARELYQSAGGLTPYFEWHTHSRQRWLKSPFQHIISLSLSGLCFLILFWVLNNVLQLNSYKMTLFGLQVFLILLGYLQYRSTRGQKIINQIILLFKHLGYEVEIRPGTGDSHRDALLGKLDLIATQDGRYVFVAFETLWSSPKGVDRKVISDLIAAVRTLSQARNYPAESKVLLILLDIEVDEDFIDMGENNGVSVIAHKVDYLQEIFERERSWDSWNKLFSRLLHLPENNKPPVPLMHSGENTKSRPELVTTKKAVYYDTIEQDKEQIIEILANAIDNHAPGQMTFARNLIDRTKWPPKHKQVYKSESVLNKDPESVARELVNYSLNQGQNPSRPSETYLGDLLQCLSDDVGGEDRGFLEAIIRKLN